MINLIVFKILPYSFDMPKPILTNKTIILVMKNKEAVSPIIGVILLLAITLVLASVMFLWVSSIVLQSSSAPVGNITIEKTGGNETTVNYTVTLNSFRPKTEPEDIICYFYDANRVSKGSFDFPETPDQEKSITININGNRDGNVNWTNDDNSMVSSYDVLKISIEVPPEQRTTLSTYSFSLRYKPDNILIAEETLQ